MPTVEAGEPGGALKTAVGYKVGGRDEHTGGEEEGPAARRAGD